MINTNSPEKPTINVIEGTDKSNLERAKEKKEPEKKRHGTPTTGRWSDWYMPTKLLAQKRYQREKDETSKGYRPIPKQNKNGWYIYLQKRG